MKEKLRYFFRQETVLCIAFILAISSMFFVPPSMEYITYVDFRTLAILFCLMITMAELRRTGIFQWVAQSLLGKVRKSWQLIWLLILLCFFSSMAVTNDVALITFVPFTFIVLDLMGAEAKKKLLVPVVVLQTIAANLGSMLTPVGNPQNLYLYGRAGLSLGDFILLMLPYALLSLLLPSDLGEPAIQDIPCSHSGHIPGRSLSFTEKSFSDCLHSAVSSEPADSSEGHPLLADTASFRPFICNH